MQLILFLLKSSWQKLAIASLTGFLSGISSAGIIALMNHILHNWGKPQPVSWLLGFIALALFSLLCGVVSQLVLIRLAQGSIFQLRLQLGRRILGADLAQLERLGSGALMAALTEDVQSIANAFWLIPFLCIDLAMVIGGLGYILWLSWQMLLLVCLIIFSFLGVYKKILVRAKRELNQSRQEKDRLFEHFKAVTDGAKELKLGFDRRESFFDDDLQVTAAKTRDSQVRGLSWFSLIDNFGKFAFFLTFGLVLFVFPRVLKMDAGTLSGYLITFTYLSKPLESLIARLPVLSQASVALDKIDSLNLSLQDQQEPQAQRPEAIAPHWQSLNLTNLHHTYPGDQEDQRFSLGTLNLSFSPGELIFIIGGNGSGKSTLAKLLTGLYVPETGQIEFAGQTITDANREWYRQHFSVVFSDFFLFDRLLGVTQDRLETAAQTFLAKLKLKHKVTIEGDRLSTTALSQGQRKRLALLYAWLEDRPIYLFDEWAADQDPAFREIFYTEFLPELKAQGKTVFVISHDDHYFSVADRVIKLEYGAIEYDKRARD
jgi:putative pyoverdin transport system ATP-binding/permease protein